MVNQLFLRSNSSLPQSSHLPYTLPSSVSCNPFICHSYENTRGVEGFFPFWNSPSSPEVPYLPTSLPPYLVAAKLGKVNRSGASHV
jgi:hypothetical protein